MKLTIDPSAEEKQKETINDLVDAFVRSGDKFSTRRTVWPEAKQQISIILKRIAQSFQIGWTVTPSNDNVALWFQQLNIGTATQPLFLKGGFLIYSQLVNGFVQVTVICPHIEKSTESERQKILDVYDPTGSSISVEKIIHNHVRRFLEELTRWNDYKPGPFEV